MNQKNPQTVVILNNIRSNENVGSIFRTSDAAGVSKIILCGYTPAPLDRFGRENKALSKTALGAEKFVAWERVENLKEAIEGLENSFPNPLVIGVEQSKNSIDYRGLKNSKLVSHTSNLALVFGNEVDGLSQEDLKLCNIIAEIPMRGAMVRQAHHPRNIKRGKESLNVSVSVGVILYSSITDGVHN